MHVLTQFALVLATLFLMAPATALIGERVVNNPAAKHDASRDR